MALDTALIATVGNPLQIGASKPFTSQGVMHVVLEVSATKPLEFELKYLAPSSETDVAQYVKNPPVGMLSRTQNPFDIVFDDKTAKQQWVLVQLGDSADWCFSPDEYGASCKDPADGRVFDTHWVDGQRNGQTGKIPSGYYDCKMIWFGVAELAACGGYVALNYHVTISQKGTDAHGNPITKRMPIVFDPDVRNDGGKVIP